MDEPRRILAISGAGGLIGTRLLRDLPPRYEPRRLVRSRAAEWTSQLEGVYGVVHLAGEPIAARRWTAAQKQKIRDSRVLGTRALVDALSACKSKPRVFVCASAIGIYGDRGDEVVNESSHPGRGFLAQTCAEWEKEAERAQALGVRTVLVRTGIVLAAQGGALAKMVPPFRFFAGGPLGSGNQWMSWIHLEDETAAILHCLENESIKGPVNFVSPNPVRMKEFAADLGRQLKRPAFLPAPGFALKILLGEMAQELLLSGQKVEPAALSASGFRFRHPKLPEALSSLLSAPPHR